MTRARACGSPGRPNRNRCCLPRARAQNNSPNPTEKSTPVIRPGLANLSRHQQLNPAFRKKGCREPGLFSSPATSRSTPRPAGTPPANSPATGHCRRHRLTFPDGSRFSAGLLYGIPTRDDATPIRSSRPATTRPHRSFGPPGRFPAFRLEDRFRIRFGSRSFARPTPFSMPKRPGAGVLRDQPDPASVQKVFFRNATEEKKFPGVLPGHFKPQRFTDGRGRQAWVRVPD